MQLHKKFGPNVEGVLIKNHQISCNNKKRRDVDCSKIKIFQELLCRIWQLLGINSKYSNMWGHFFDRKQIYISVANFVPYKIINNFLKFCLTKRQINWYIISIIFLRHYQNKRPLFEIYSDYPRMLTKASSLVHLRKYCVIHRY